ncbi:MAG: hypothetical protein ACRC0V_09215 [Fusobacteriaceae bacterium]
MTKFELLMEQKYELTNEECLCSYCGDQGLKDTFQKIHTNFLCPNCSYDLRPFELSEPYYLDFIHYPNEVQMLILRLNEYNSEEEMFGFIAIKTTEEELLQYKLKERLDHLKSLMFKSKEVLNAIKEIKIQLVGWFGINLIQLENSKFKFNFK